MSLTSSGKQWPDNSQTSSTGGGSVSLPTEFSYSTAAFTLSAATLRDFSVAIPSNRLYGISVLVTGMAAGQNCFVQMFGDNALTEVQYSANFTSVTNADTSQAWRYRSRAADGILHLRVTNTGSTTLTNIQISFKVEPF